MALYLPFFPAAGAALSSGERFPLVASAVGEATGTWKVSSVKPGAMLNEGCVVDGLCLAGGYLMKDLPRCLSRQKGARWMRCVTAVKRVTDEGW